MFLFRALGQLSFGCILLIITLFQAWYWGIHSRPSAEGIFWLSVEALLFSAYAIVATALGFMATERVEKQVGSGT